MKSRHLTKKYKRKSRSRRRKTRRRVLKGGTLEDKKNTFIKKFFDNIEDHHFPEALYALHTFYTSDISQDKINEFLFSENFKNVYNAVFYTNVQIPNIGEGVQTNVEPKETLMFFLSYIFSKLLEGQNIDFGNGVVLNFTPGPNSFLKILKKFFCYLDTACVLTISYQISQTTFNRIYESQQTRVLPIGVTNGQLALYNVIQNLHFLGSISNSSTRAGQMIPLFPGIVTLLDNMTRGTEDVRIYSFNPTNLCSLIKMTINGSIWFK
jgi:hypothetical protein